MENDLVIETKHNVNRIKNYEDLEIVVTSFYVARNRDLRNKRSAE